MLCLVLAIMNFSSRGSICEPMPSHPSQPTDDFVLSLSSTLRLIRKEDELVENGADPVGILMVRGPSVGKLSSMEESYVSIPSGEDQGWIGTGLRATVQTNGAFRLL
ncbi:hypothetical protein DFH06DRAFT_1356101 [Mycena polygramma]|nr:hypothetical protein DFH06DRAFT_1356101 [Mycena polygramma]